MKFIGIWTTALIVCLGILFIAGTNNGRECLQYAPTPTPIPLSNIYTEWIPMPGTSPGSGNGWIKATELRNYPYLVVLTDEEYHAIELKHGMRQTMGSKWGYGFPPRQGFSRLYGGVILKNEWLPKRLK